jgi:FkbH-like protein
MVSHPNIVSNLACIDRSFGHTADSVVVSWLPPFHDMGLVYGIFQPIYNGCHGVLMPPMDFVRNPGMWLQAISDFRASHSGAPNFGYDLCVQRLSVEQLVNVDLSSWKVAFTGAEVIRKRTIDEFTDKFGPLGFCRTSFLPAYGLAEATLKVSSAHAGQGPTFRRYDRKALEQNKAILAKEEGSERTVDLVGCGTTELDTRVVIVDPESHVPCPTGCVGEVWVSGSSVGHGYWKRPSESNEVFHARLSDNHDSGAYLRTGDLGFTDGVELFLNGRMKDLIIIRGRNLYPDDIETTVRNCDPLLETGRGAAFSIDEGGEEQVALVLEIPRRTNGSTVERIANIVSQSISEQHGVRPSTIAFVKRGSIPITSSGKVQRQLCRELFLTDKLDTINTFHLPHLPEVTDCVLSVCHATSDRKCEESHEPLESVLQTCIANLLRLPKSIPDVNAPLVHLGIDSMMAARLAQTLEARFELDMDVSELLGETTISGIAVEIRKKRGHPYTGKLPLILHGDDPVQDDYLPLSAEQLRFWLMDNIADDHSDLNIAAVIRIQGHVALSAVRASLSEIVQRHEPLRTSFVTREGHPFQKISNKCAVQVSVIDMGERPLSASDSACDEVLAQFARVPFLLTEPPLIRALLIRSSDQSTCLGIVGHHIICDAASIRLLADEFMILYRAHQLGRPWELPKLPVRYRDFVRWHSEWATEERTRADAIYWRTKLGDLPERLELFDRCDSNPGGRSLVRFVIPRDMTDALLALSKKHDATLFMTLLAAYNLLLRLISGQTDLLVGCPTSGRVRSELNRLIGLFAYPIVVRTDMSGDPTFSDVLRGVRRTALEAYSHSTIPFAGLVKVVNPRRYKDTTPLFQTMFNLMTDEGIVRDDESGIAATLETVDAGYASCDLALTIIERPDGLRGELTYRTSAIDSETAGEIGQAYSELLRQCVTAACERVSAYRLTPKVEALRRMAKTETAPQTRLVISSTFTANPIEDSLTFWGDYLRQPMSIKMADYNQVFQQLLDPASVLSTNSKGINVLLIRFEDWLQNGSNSADEDGRMRDVRRLDEIVGDFISAVRAQAARPSGTLLVVLCPASPALTQDQVWAHNLRAWESRVCNHLGTVPGVRTLTTGEVARLYPVSRYYDSCADALGKIPYSPLFFTALGTAIARNIRALVSPPYKAIILDCDETLWAGVCGEDGPTGVRIDEVARWIQTFMVGQQEAGKLLCIVSKNNETDVRAVFDCHPEMPLRWRHITASRINWLSKSANIMALANELNLSLDCLIFIDDNPAERAEVQASCPATLVLELPREREGIPTFLSHVWAFDCGGVVTSEDAKRAAFYQSAARRAEAARQFSRLEDFVSTLALDVRIFHVSTEQVARVAQLTQRTTQFNLSGRRYTEADIIRFVADQQNTCLVVEASDRFGDYGIVGSVLYSVTDEFLNVDAFVLSCRALGKGVEDRIWARITADAAQRAVHNVSVTYVRTARNEPARAFLDRIGCVQKSPADQGWIVKISTEGVGLVPAMSA